MYSEEKIMNSDEKGGKSRKIVSMGITLTVVLMLLFAGPAGAISLTIDGANGKTVKVGDDLKFNVTAEFEDPDSYVPVENLSLKITGAGDAVKEIVFSPDGTLISGNSQKVTITKIEAPSSEDYGYGGGYGYDADKGEGYTFGYGYGYGPNGKGPVRFAYEITLDTSFLNVGEHTMTFFLNTGSSAKPAFESKVASFEVTSRGNSGGGSSSGGSGGGASGEPAKNVKAKEMNGQPIMSGKHVKYQFRSEGVPIQQIEFDPTRTYGRVYAQVEVLKSRSKYASTDPEGEVYQYVNIWIGNSGTKISENMENAEIRFRVSKAWINDNNIDLDSIALQHYTDGEWNPLPTEQLEEDKEYFYFTATTPSFSPFAITSVKSSGIVEIKPESESSKGYATGSQVEEAEGIEGEGEEEQSSGLPGFGSIIAAAGLVVSAVCIRRRMLK